jgi:hypothetical protein
LSSRCKQSRPGLLSDSTHAHRPEPDGSDAGARQSLVENAMQILAYYCSMVIVGTIAAALLGLWLDPISQLLSVTVFFILFFGVLWLAWIVAVWLTEPKATASASGNQPAE